MNDRELEIYIQNHPWRSLMEAAQAVASGELSLTETKDRVKLPESGANKESLTTAQDQKRQAVISEIASAFDQVLLGSGTSLHQARAIDDWQPDDVVSEAGTFDVEKHWREIADAKVEKFTDTLSFMDAEGFRFHIPCFMTWTLQNAHSSSDAVDATLSSLDLNFAGGQFKEFHSSMWSLLTDEQRKAIASFLTYIVEAKSESYHGYVAANALLQYWNRYAGAA